MSLWLILLTSPVDARPRVALVLSGGGARGIAHVGVLRALEEMHVPVDCVAGTSMGAIVGGLYAAGYSPDELESTVRTIDWHDLIRDQPDRRRLPYRRKVDDVSYLTRWELGVSRRGVTLPTGLVAGHRLGVTLRILALRAGGVQDFDDLPLPFRAVATDIRTGDAVVLGSGDLATAMRASMAVPGLFSAVEIDERLLVDGGVIANLPVEAARALGADVILAVDLGKPLATRERPESISGIVSQTLDFLSRREVERALGGVDILLRPEVSDFGFLAFDAGEALIERGIAAVRPKQDALRALAVSDAEWAEYLRRQRRKTPSYWLRNVAVDPGTPVARAIDTRAGRLLDPMLLERDLTQIWELSESESVDFDLSPVGEGEWSLRIKARPKAWGPNFLRAGISVTTDLEGASSFNVLGALTMTRLNRYGGELKVSAQAGEGPLVAVEMLQPLHRSRVPFVAVSVGGGTTKVQLPVEGAPVQYRFWRQRISGDLGLALGRWGEVRAGLLRDTTTGRATHGGDDTPKSDLRDAGFHAALIFDQLDRVNFPRSGLLAAAEYYESLESMGADQKYRRVGVGLVAARTAGRHTLLALGNGSSALGGVLADGGRVRLGGLFSLSGLPPGEVSGSYGGVLSLLYLYRLGGLPWFGEGVYAGVSVEGGNAWERIADVSMRDLRTSGSVVLGIDTVIGPLYLAHGYNDSGKDSLYLYLGRTF